MCQVLEGLGDQCGGGGGEKKYIGMARKRATVATKETKRGRKGAIKKTGCKTKAQRDYQVRQTERGRQRETIHHQCRLQQENPSGLPSPSRAHQAITVMSATARVTSCIYSITACTDVWDKGSGGEERSGKEKWSKTGLRGELGEQANSRRG